MSTTIENIERAQMREGLPGFAAGDQVRVHFQVVEGTRRRTQVFEGVVIRRQGSGLRETFTVRKQSFGVGVERTFPLHSPKIEKLEVTARGEVRRAKLYYLRGRVGKKARVAERRWGADDPVAATAAAATSDALEAGPEGDQAVAEEPEGVTEAVGTAGEPEASAETEPEVAGEASDEDPAGSGETEAAGETGEAVEEDSSGSAETEAETETTGDAAEEGSGGGTEPESGDRPG